MQVLCKTLWDISQLLAVFSHCCFSSRSSWTTMQFLSPSHMQQIHLSCCSSTTLSSTFNIWHCLLFHRKDAATEGHCCQKCCAGRFLSGSLEVTLLLFVFFWCCINYMLCVRQVICVITPTKEIVLRSICVFLCLLLATTSCKNYWQGYLLYSNHEAGFFMDKIGGGKEFVHILPKVGDFW